MKLRKASKSDTAPPPPPKPVTTGPPGAKGQGQVTQGQGQGIYDRVDAPTPPFPVSHAQQAAQLSDSPAPFPVPANHATVSSGNLDDMLGNLNTDLSKQGIMNVPKGHCAACAKPIVGQVRCNLC